MILKYIFILSLSCFKLPSCVLPSMNTLSRIIHGLNNEYITLVSVPVSLLHSTKEGKLGYFLGRDGSQLIPGSFGTPPGNLCEL